MSGAVASTSELSPTWGTCKRPIRSVNVRSTVSPAGDGRALGILVPMAGRPVTLRSLALLAGAALALHELRYALAPQPHGSAHGYLDWVVPLVATLLALGAGAYVLALARAREGMLPARAPSRLAALWPGA